MKKKIRIVLIFLVVILTVLGIFYYDGLFKKETYSGLLVYRVDILKNSAIVKRFKHQSEYNLELSEYEKFVIEIDSGWKYEIKRFNEKKQFPKVEYKYSDYVVYKDGILYLNDDYNINEEKFIKSAFINNTNFFQSCASTLHTTEFNFFVTERGKYEVKIFLNVIINNKSYCETTNLVFNIN